MMKVIFVDANPKSLAVVDQYSQLLVYEKFGEPVTNNVAEYKAIIKGIEVTTGDIEIRSDSQLAVKQMNGEYSIKDDTLRDLAAEAHMMSKGRIIKYVWISRKDNLAGKFLG